jgi:hypothetical protein
MPAQKKYRSSIEHHRAAMKSAPQISNFPFTGTKGFETNPIPRNQKRNIALQGKKKIPLQYIVVSRGK